MSTSRAPRWLSTEEEAAWRALGGVLVRLPGALEAQLQRDSGLSFIEYYTLARLSEDPEHTQRMSVLAELTDASLSRLSHLVKRMEARGLVRREPDPTDGRFTNAILLPAGMAKMESAAPEHVAYVRHLVVDNISAERLRRLGRDAEQIVQRIDSPAR